MQTLCSKAGLWIAPNWPKLREITMTLQFSDMVWTSTFFDVALFLLSRLVTGPSFMSISALTLELWQFSFIKDWPEIRNRKYPVCVFPNIWRLELVRDTKFGMNVSNKILLNTANARVTAFTVSKLLRENQQEWGRGGKITLHPPTLIRVKNNKLLNGCFYLQNKREWDLRQKKSFRKPSLW